MDYTETEEVQTSPMRGGDLKVYQAEKAGIDMQISTAHAYPRDIRRFIANSITAVTLSKEMAEKCNYSVKKGDKIITGASVTLAKVIAQNYCNLRIDSRVTHIDTTRLHAESIAWDLETNTAIRVQVTRSITGKQGRYSEDLIAITSNAAISIALRNAVFTIIPKQYIDKLYNAATEAVTGKISDENMLTAKRKLLFEGFKSEYGVTEAELLAFLNKATINIVDAKDILVLIGVGNALKAGEVSVESQFRPQKSTPPPATEKKEVETERLLLVIKKCTKLENLKKLEKDIKSNEERSAYDTKFAELNKK